jgi:hypothetical protein
MPPPVIPILKSTKYANAWFEHGHPYNDEAYSLVNDAPLMAAKMSRYEEVLIDMERALSETRAQLLALVEAKKVEAAQLSHVEQALSQLRTSRRELEDVLEDS